MVLDRGAIFAALAAPAAFVFTLSATAPVRPPGHAGHRRPAGPAPAALPAPGRVSLPVAPLVPREGQWQPVGGRVGGRVAMYQTAFQADVNYPSEMTYAVWMDTDLVHLGLVPGYQQPGGTWAHPPYVTPAELPLLLAAFNGGFQFRAGDARGGFYLDGRTAVPLVAGSASLVIYKDGRVDIGAWGTGVSMTPDVRAVLQNATLLVGKGRVASTATYWDTSYWGFTLGNVAVVARSAVGVTADGALVYVAGPAMTARSLGESLVLAGAVRAMTLDINPEWVTFNFYSRALTGQVSGANLYPGMQRSPDRYLPPVWEGRDFFEVLEGR